MTGARSAANVLANAQRCADGGRGRCCALPMHSLQTANHSRSMGQHEQRSASAGERGRGRGLVLCGRKGDGDGSSKRKRSPSPDSQRAVDGMRQVSESLALPPRVWRVLAKAARLCGGHNGGNRRGQRTAMALGYGILFALDEHGICKGCKVNLRKRECECPFCEACERRLPECVCDSSDDSSSENGSGDDSSSEDGSGDNDASDDGSNDHGPGGFDPDFPDCWNCGSASVTCNDEICPDCGAEPRHCWQCGCSMDSDDEECPTCGAERLGSCAECNSWCMDAGAEYCGFCGCDYEF